MKLEKVNDNQIKCILTKEDLDCRNLKISELAYGTEKAKSLFKDMMQKANFEFGFEAENIPLMIEAIPMTSGCIVLIITKVSEPEELDTRFSKFTEAPEEDDDLNDFTELNSKSEGINDFNKFLDENGKFIKDDNSVTPLDINTVTDVFTFKSLNDVCEVAKYCGDFNGNSTLYKNPNDSVCPYYLVIYAGPTDRQTYIKYKHLFLEYGKSKYLDNVGVSHLAEYCSVLIKDNALKSLK